jgi:hypothetical protein
MSLVTKNPSRAQIAELLGCQAGIPNERQQRLLTALSTGKMFRNVVAKYPVPTNPNRGHQIGRHGSRLPDQHPHPIGYPRS